MVHVFFKRLCREVSCKLTVLKKNGAADIQVYATAVEISAILGLGPESGWHFRLAQSVQSWGAMYFEMSICVDLVRLNISSCPNL